MKRIFGYIVAVAIVVAVASCSVVNQAIKSGDPQYAYEQALMLYENGKWSQASDLFEACRHIYMGSPGRPMMSPGYASSMVLLRCAMNCVGDEKRISLPSLTWR